LALPWKMLLKRLNHSFNWKRTNSEKCISRTNDQGMIIYRAAAFNVTATGTTMPQQHMFHKQRKQQ